MICCKIIEKLLTTNVFLTMYIVIEGDCKGDRQTLSDVSQENGGYWSIKDADHLQTSFCKGRRDLSWAHSLPSKEWADTVPLWSTLESVTGTVP